VGALLVRAEGMIGGRYVRKRPVFLEFKIAFRWSYRVYIVICEKFGKFEK
jgi:hypothetical protein